MHSGTNTRLGVPRSRSRAPLHSPLDTARRRIAVRTDQPGASFQERATLNMAPLTTTGALLALLLLLLVAAAAADEWAMGRSTW
jgi:hypothetical protein